MVLFLESRFGFIMRVFAKICVDYVGFFIIKIIRRVLVKRYLCLFICFVIRAVYLEMVYLLSIIDFLNAFSRMVVIRGRSEEVISDNGSNFVGVDREFREFI